MDKVLQLLLTEAVAYAEAHPDAMRSLIQAGFAYLQQELLKALAKQTVPTA